MVLGYTTGVFDLFHIGHLTFLKNAKGLCDKLIVGVTSDELVSYKNKKTVICFSERLEIIKSIKYVDAAIIQDNIDKFKAWQKIKFDFLFVGDDWFQNDNWNQYQDQLEKVNVRIIYFPYTKTTSSTLINETLLNLRRNTMCNYELSEKVL